MELKKCPEGHDYDASLYSECPTCKEMQNGGGAGQTMGGGTGQGQTLPLGYGGGSSSYGTTAPVSGEAPGAGYQNGGMYEGGSGSGGYGATAPVTGASPLGGGAPVGGTVPLTGGYTAPVTGGYTAPMTGGMGGASRDEGQTIAVIHQQLGIDPVVGWLVAINGAEKGRDYRIHSDNNYIGRSEKMDICIRGDDTISRVNHAVIAYDTRERMFYFAPGEGRSINRVNGKAMLGTVILNPYDELEIGVTKLIFIPFCGERFEWKSENN